MAAYAILTRPEGRNAYLAERLRQSGYVSVCLPALQLQPLVTDASRLPHPQNYDVLLFVSGYAARLWLRLMEPWLKTHPWPGHMLCATVGEASAQVLVDSGLIPNEAIVYPSVGHYGQDSEGLWVVLEPRLPRQARVLIVRGQTGRDWLSERFADSGATVERLALYTRQARSWSPQEQSTVRDALHRPQNVIFLLSSIQSVNAVLANIKQLGLETVWSRCHFVVIHERIAVHLESILQGLGTGLAASIRCCAPTDDAMHAAMTALNLTAGTPLGLQSSP